MQRINRSNINTTIYPERIVQVGEGNFLRAFFDWMVHRMNQSIGYNTGVVIIKPRPGTGKIKALREQDGLFTVRLTAMGADGPSASNEVIDCVTRAISPYDDHDQFMALAENPDLTLLVSNTTEAGITFDDGDLRSDSPPSSFPGKLTKLLHARFVHFKGAADKGLVILPLELIPDNGSTLKKIVTKHALNWNLGTDFIEWLDTACCFSNSLVDRIVTGFPDDTIEELQEQLGYEDDLLVEGEQFHLWAIEDDPRVREAFPAHSASLNVIFTNDLDSFRTRKVRILNGAHTAMTVIGLCMGIETVREAIEDPVLGAFIDRMIFEEVVPTLGTDEELRSYASDILHRFRNPYIRHLLSDISLNSTAKYTTRIHPSLTESERTTGNLPFCCTLALAAVIRLYKGQMRGVETPLKDDQAKIDRIQSMWQQVDMGAMDIGAFTEKLLGDNEIWGADLSSVPGLTISVAALVAKLNTDDPATTLQSLIQQKFHSYEINTK